MTIASGYLPILLMILLGMLLAGTFTVVGLYLGPRLRSKVKDTPFESGFVRDGTEGSRYDVKFYMTALVFLVFDVEIVFLIRGPSRLENLAGSALQRRCFLSEY